MFSLEFFLTSLVVVLIPGTGVLYTISTGLVHKWKYGIWAAFGCTLGILPHLFACILGISVIMHISAQLFIIMKILGSVYLFYLSWKTWISAGKITFSDEKEDVTILQIIQKGILLNILNPKLTLFFLSFLPQFIPANLKNTTSPMILLSLVFMAMTFFVFVGYGILASFVSDMIIKSKNMMKNIERSFACIFAALAVKLATSEK